jgi:hypothetical protein
LARTSTCLQIRKEKSKLNEAHITHKMKNKWLPHLLIS